MRSVKGALHTPAQASGRCSVKSAQQCTQLAHQAVKQHLQVPLCPSVASQLRHVTPTRSCCSVTAISTASASNGTPINCQQQETVAAAHGLSVIASHWPLQQQQQQQQQQHTGSAHGAAHHAQAEQQHAVRLHTAAGAAVNTWQSSGQSSGQTAGQHVGQTAAWQLLQLQGRDGLSARILACRKPAELLQLASQIASKGSKLHAARFTVMAALLTAADVSCSSSETAADAAPDSGTTGDAAVLQQVLQLLTHGSAYYPKPPLACLSSVYLQETLSALQQLVQQTLSVEQQQAVQQQLQPVVLQLAEQDVLSGIHACTGVQQLSAVVRWLQCCFTAVHVKAALVQLARLCGSSIRHDSSSGSSSRGRVSNSSSSSSLIARELADQLLQLLLEQQQQQQLLQPHHAASIVWSLGQLQSLGLQQYSQQLGQQLLHVALSGVARLNPRVTAMLLHGAARLQLQLPAPDQQQQGSAVVHQLLQNTQQQLPSCDPQALSGLVWSLAALQQQPGGGWMQQFYHSSWPMLLPRQQGVRSTSSSSSSSQPAAAAAARHANGSSRKQRQDEQTRNSSSYNDGWRDSQSAFNAQELSAVLSALVHLEQQPPAEWITAAAASCQRQLQQFEQHELAVTLWAFAKLQQQLPEQMLAAAVDRVEQLQGSFSPQSTTLLLYALTCLEQHQQQLVGQLLPQLQQSSSTDRPTTLEGALQQSSEREQPALAAADAAAVAAAAESESAGGGSSSSSSSSVHQLFEAVSSQAGDQLQQHNAHDLALLAWSLGRHCWKQQQQQQQQLHLPDASWLQSYMAAAAQQLQRGRMSSRAMTMTLWGLGTVLHAAGKQHGTRSTSSSSNSCSSSASSTVDDLQLQAANSSGSRLSSSWSPATAFWSALQQQSAQKLSHFSGHELANLLWGAGQFVCCTHVKPSSEWVDVAACHCLDLMDQLSSYQLVAALQGLVWLKHPRGLSLLQTALSEPCSSRLGSAAPDELLLLLRGCVFYRHTPAAAARAALLKAARRRAKQMPTHQVAQLLYLLGKMQQQHNKRQSQMMLRQLAAAAAALAGHSPFSSSDESSSYYQQQLLQQRQSLMQQQRSKAAVPSSIPARSSSSSSNKAADPRCTTSSRWQQQQQQPVCAVQIERLVPGAALCELVTRMRGCLQECSATQVALMFWGVSQLARVGLQMQPAAAAGSSVSSSTASTTIHSKRLDSSSSSVSSASNASQQLLAAALPFSECPAGVELLDELYSYSLQNMHAFSSSEVSALLYALHQLGVVQPPPGWLEAVVGRTQQLMLHMDGQALAALAVALAGFNWVPRDGWLALFVEAAAAAEQAGAFSTQWQQQCFSNGLSALDPVAGQMWLQRTKVCSSRTPVVAAAAAAAAGGMRNGLLLNLRQQ